MDKTEFGGRALVYLPKYVPPDDELFEMSDGDIEDNFLTALERMYPEFSRDSVEAFRVSKVREVFPVQVLDYSAKVPGHKTSVENVWMVNSSHITNGTLNVNETVELAEAFLEEHQIN